jgi:hypothetical protein
MTTEIRFTYIRGRGKEKSIMLQIWIDGKPTNHVLETQHVWSDHPHELFHNYRNFKTKDHFIGVGMKYTIEDEDE